MRPVTVRGEERRALRCLPLSRGTNSEGHLVKRQEDWTDRDVPWVFVTDPALSRPPTQ
jgi:hypothetical protein